MSDLICRKNMMRLLVVLAALQLTACKIEQLPAGTPTNVAGSSLRTWHDDERRVTCWLHNVNGGQSLSCLPDWMLVAKDKEAPHD